MNGKAVQPIDLAARGFYDYLYIVESLDYINSLPSIVPLITHIELQNCLEIYDK